MPERAAVDDTQAMEIDDALIDMAGEGIADI